jgi:hypothetical protein
MHTSLCHIVYRHIHLGLGLGAQPSKCMFLGIL